MTDRPTRNGTAVILTSGQSNPAWMDEWCESAGVDTVLLSSADAVAAHALRSRPRMVLLDARGTPEWTDEALATCARLKRDSFSAVVPILVLVSTGRFDQAFANGADEVIREGVDDAQAAVRLAAMIRRSDRDTDVHPSTRLPGNREINAELERRIAEREHFAVCYADLDHFKEFNDRYSYFRGNEVIELLARILHDVVKGWCGEQGFIGHIGGDDFLFVVPLAAMPRVCDELIRVFDELMPLQYSESDRRVGYFLGKDRRGQLHRVPLMTLSVGVVTNQRRRFRLASEVSELATEMKSYAKTLAGSVWTVDRRRDEESPANAVHTESIAEHATLALKTGGVR